MAAEIVNLRHIRKEKARADREKKAEDNRRAFGQTKAEKTLKKAERERAAKALDGHRLHPEKD